ncbi:MAG TPA: helix-turn-helix domain-containing GNAT family N-acetyltransferase [Mycobacteriales bacterium]|nr:helix-turn-helix domain-containing GNAT family N-acetyltransferase [Mycobacteriales bacterium]
MTDLTSAIDGVRAFNRFYTSTAGLLHAGLVGTRFTLTEARVLFELGQSDSTEVADLRRRLGLDAGYLSRILSRFAEAGLIGRERSAADARRQVLTLTGSGREAFGALDRRTVEQVGELLQELSGSERSRLLAAMRTIEQVLGEVPAPAGYVLREPEAGDLGWVVQRNAALYAQEYGWDETYEALVAKIVAAYAEKHDPKRERAWIAEIDGEPVGCVFCVRADDETAKLRLLLVDPRARGMGIGERLVAECIRFARRAGYRRLTLWTNDVLSAARRIYQRAGFVLVDEEEHVSFGQKLTGQTWQLEL